MYYSIWLWHTYPSIHSQWIAIYIKLLVRIALTHYLLDGSQYFCWQLFSSAIDGATRIPLHRHAYTIHSTANGTVSETNYSGASALTLILSLSRSIYGLLVYPDFLQPLSLAFRLGKAFDRKKPQPKKPLFSRQTMRTMHGWNASIFVLCNFTWTSCNE